MKKAGAESKKAKILILGSWSDGRQRSLTASDSSRKDAVSITTVRNLLEKDLETSAQIMTVIGKAPPGGPPVQKKEEQLLNSPLHCAGSILSFDVFEDLVMKVYSFFCLSFSLFICFLLFFSLIFLIQNKTFQELVEQLIKAVVTTTRVKDVYAKLGQVNKTLFLY